MDLIWIIYLISFIISTSTSNCSQFFCHTEVLLEDGLTPSLREDPDKMIIYEREIIPWLKAHLPEEEVERLDIETMDRRGAIIPDHPMFRDSKLLFELCEVLISNGLDDVGSVVLKFIRSQVYFSSAYTILIESIALDSFIVCKQILKLWFPDELGIVSAIQNLIELRMNEDKIIELIDIVWDDLQRKLSGQVLNEKFSYILILAMKRQYVSIFEDILERIPRLIHFTNSRLKLGCERHVNRYVNRRKRLTSSAGETVVHELCHNLLSSNLHDDNNVGDPYESGPHSPIDLFSFDHNIRAYSSANSDLLKAMVAHGADINCRDGNGMTPLHLAIYLRNHHIVDVLLRSGANYSSTISKYSMQEWRDKYANRQMKQVFIDFFAEIREKSEALQKERESRKIEINNTWRLSK